MRGIYITCFVLFVFLCKARADGDIIYFTTANGVVLKCKIVNENEKTIQVGDGQHSGASADFSFTTIEIPMEVNGYKVVSIAEKAFTFHDKLNTIILPSTLTSIGRFAFQYCPNVRTIVVNMEYPMEIDMTVFGNWFTYISEQEENDIIDQSNENSIHDIEQINDAVYEEAVVFVPLGSKVRYNSTQFWNKFKNIEEQAPTSLQQISNCVTKRISPLYDLSGRRLTREPQKGVYIKDGRKVVIK